MSRDNKEPLVLQIGFNRCGTKFLTSMFELNNYRARHWGNGAFAEDIFYSKQSNRIPFRQWSRAHFISDMECVHLMHKPMLEGFKEYRYLAKCFPQAIFILNERNVEEWIASRFCHQNGDYRKFHALHLGVREDELPEIWYSDWMSHIKECVNFFEGNDRFFRFNLDDDAVEGLCSNLSEWYQLDVIPKRTDATRVKTRRAQIASVMDSLSVQEENKTSRPMKFENQRFSEEIASHCLGESAVSDDPFLREPMSNLFAEWDGRDRIIGKSGKPLPLIRLSGPQPGFFVADRQSPKIERVQGIVNEHIKLGFNKAIRIDPEDSRRFGSGNLAPPRRPLLTYNRRDGVKNMVLWPLPGYHSPLAKGFVRNQPIDEIPFENKRDICAWRGNLTGMSFVEAGLKTEKSRASFQILDDLAGRNRNQKSLDGIQRELLTLTRFKVVKTFFANPLFELGFSLPNKHKPAGLSSILSQYCKPSVPTNQFHKYKYLLSLSGHDTGSNFLWSASTNSVVLKEEDGWEVFYSSVFKPWEHYIPLKLGAGDLEEKLAWAQQNQSRCKEISAAAEQICIQLANLKNRELFLSLIADAYSQ